MTSSNPDDTYNEIDARYLLREDWRTFTPTVTQSVAVTVTVTYARYIVLARLVVMQVQLAVTSAGVTANAISIGNIPSVVAPSNPSGLNIIGTGFVRDSGTADYFGALLANAASDFRIRRDSQANDVGIAPSFALASGDAISFVATYYRA